MLCNQATYFFQGVHEKIYAYVYSYTRLHVEENIACFLKDYLLI